MSGYDKSLFMLRTLGLAAIHFLLSLVTAFQAGITGGLGTILSNILLFPLNLLADSVDTVLFWMLWIVLSLLWGLGINYLRHS